MMTHFLNISDSFPYRPGLLPALFQDRGSKAVSMSVYRLDDLRSHRSVGADDKCCQVMRQNKKSRTCLLSRYGVSGNQRDRATNAGVAGATAPAFSGPAEIPCQSFRPWAESSLWRIRSVK